jgi:glutamyl-tRNA reductase
VVRHCRSPFHTLNTPTPLIRMCGPRRANPHRAATCTEHQMWKETASTDDWTRGQLMVAGVSHRTASLDVREQLARAYETWREATLSIPGVLLATCNRVELYNWVPVRSTGAPARLATAVANAAGLPLATFESSLFTKVGLDAVLHLVRVVSGLDSVVLGDSQIHAQVRAALRLASANGSLSAPLIGVFGRALEAGRRIRRATTFGPEPSTASAAVSLARGLLEPPAAGAEQRTAVVLGAGVVASEAVRALLTTGMRVVVLNRTREHRRRLAADHPTLVTGPLERLPFVLSRASVVVCATAARQPIVGCRRIRGALANRPQLPLVILDLAMPRAVEPAARTLPGVQLIDLDDLEQLSANRGPTRSAIAERGEALAVKETEAIARWMRVRAIAPAIVELRQHGEEVRALELRRVARQLQGLTPEERMAVEVMTMAIVNQLLHGPTLALRQAAARSMDGGRRSHTAISQMLQLDRFRCRVGIS